ncbi:hypothetical protein [Mycobacterium asiaticum]|uniref:Uncharacterized protein n=1 Tax=Mycobacterium asiaticum TaxID=1790 RepID=A0A1A3D1H7_MYCAS|nr:hypothetical protein [Mycobacterium asiaticum]OBI92890.1 hypothetical protein A5661_25010 [Mycobacterium asiaticum]OBJ90910.1 hypothetical protein A5640_02115 [Mycobacterium asiaticum]ORA15942.1 hypothetical protein BST16_08740 [Mycobacterium asiaticum DSM 44297]
MSWTRYEGKAPADPALDGDALWAQLQDHIRLHNPHYTDVRLHNATATDEYDTSVQPARRWYLVTYLAEGA